jgi:peptidoglycan hydrolase-like protein with peptidoglycan-binding domain
MEFLAFVHNAVNYEDPAPDSEITLDLTVNSSAGIALAGIALAVATVSASPEAASATTAVLAQGSTGNAVSNVQKVLGIEADGNFGQLTETKVMDFQIRQGLKQVDGVVGQETATALGLNEKYQPTYLGFVETNTGIGLNVRSGPGIDFRRIGGLEDGTVVETFGEPVERFYNWQRIGEGAWVATDYVAPYYEGTGYSPYDDYGYDDYGYDSQGDSCGCRSYQPRSYSPCDRSYEPYYEGRGYDTNDGYYQDYSYESSYYQEDYRERSSSCNKGRMCSL